MTAQPHVVGKVPGEGPLQRLVHSALFNQIILGVIVFNALLMGLEATKWFEASLTTLLLWLEKACTAVFVFEAAIKIATLRLRYFRSAWNWFDFSLVAISLVPEFSSFSALRVLRVLRILRLIEFFPSLRRIVAALLLSIPSMGSVFALLSLFFYIFGILAVQLFGQEFPQWFGDLGDATYTLFQVMTLESWSMGIVRPVMEVYPHAWLFFVSFIMLTTFLLVNMVIGIAVSAIEEAKKAHEAERLAQKEEAA